MRRRYGSARRKRGSLHVPCPVCGKRVPWEENPFRPFCSERCKLIDLGEWITEGYRITTPLEDSEDEIPSSSGREGEDFI